MNLADVERRKLQVKADLATERERHKKTVEALQWELKEAEERARLICDGLDEAKILHAEHVIYVRGSYANAGVDRGRALEAAIKDILEGGKRLKREYRGTKNYDRWRGQEIECSYGMGPSHGSICFEIGLTAPTRKRTEDAPLDEEEIDAAVYYLRNLERIQAAKSAAEEAAKAA